MPAREGLPDLLSYTDEWADVELWDYREDGKAIVDIEHTEDYLDAFGLLYSVIQSGEISERVLRLTEKCIMLCPPHYTAWSVRLQCLLELEKDLNSEWTLCYAVAAENSKNYQLWNHRRQVAMRMSKENAYRELEFAAKFLEDDAKNYHIWAHRQMGSSAPVNWAKFAVCVGDANIYKCGYYVTRFTVP